MRKQKLLSPIGIPQAVDSEKKDNKMPDSSDMQPQISHVETNGFEHHAEENIRSREKRLSILSMNAPVGLFQTDKNGNCIFVNKRWCMLADMTAKHAEGQGWTDALHPEDKERVFTEWYEAARTGKEFKSDYRFRTKKGKVTWLHGSAIALKDSQGKVSGYLGTVVDITEPQLAKQRQDFLEKIANKLSTSLEDSITLQEVARLIVPFLADYSRIAIINSDNEIKEVAVNHSDPSRNTLAAELYDNYKNRPETTHGIQNILLTGKSEIIEKVDESILTTVANNRKLLKNIKQIGLCSYMGVPLIARGKVIGAMTFSSTQKDRNYTKEDLRFAEELATRIALALDNIRLFREVQEELKERKRFEDNLLKSKEQYKRLIDLSPLPMAVHVNGVIVYTNQAAAKLIGATSPAELIGKNTMLFVHPDYHEIVKKRVKQIYKQRKPHTDIIEEKFIRLNGEVIEVEIASLYLEYEGKPAIQVIIRDITERKRLERQKNEFLGIASHELKTPVTSLKAFGQVIQKRLAKKGDKSSVVLLEKMDAQINKLTNLIEDLLDISKIEGGRLQFHNELFSFDEWVHEVVEEIQRTTEKHTLTINGTTNKNITGDKERIGQVIINFLTNAIKYSPHSDKIIIHLSADKQELKLGVEDFGVGIQKENLTHVFERFYRIAGKTHDTVPGMGLGLYISSEIIHRQGGRIWAESKKGKGSLFYFTLPLRMKHIKQQKNTLIEEEIKHE